MRRYEMMVILDPQLDERAVAPSLDQFLGVVKTQGGSINKVDVWGKRRLSYEIDKRTEGIYAVLDLSCTPATVAELDRQLSLSETVLRTKVLRRDPRKG
jgi:small subunit ribosomal protein S6